MSKKAKLIFTASILLNLLLLGAGSGMLVKRAYNNPWSQAYQDLGPQSQHSVARAFQKARKDMRATRKEFHAARRELTKILQKDTLDEEAYAQAMERMNEAQAKMHTHKIEMMKDIMRDLSPEEREILTDRIMAPFSKHPRVNYFGPEKTE